MSKSEGVASQPVLERRLLLGSVLALSLSYVAIVAALQFQWAVAADEWPSDPARADSSSTLQPAPLASAAQAHAGTSRYIDELARACAEAGVRLHEVHAAAPSAAPLAPASTLHVQLEGRYPAIVRALSVVHRRQPSVFLQRLLVPGNAAGEPNVVASATFALNPSASAR